MRSVYKLVPTEAKSVELCSAVMRRYPDLPFTPKSIRKDARIKMLKELKKDLGIVIDNHARIRSICGCEDNYQNKLYFAKQFYSFVKFTWNHVSVCIEQDPFFSRHYTDYKLQAYFDGERKDIRAVKKVYAEVSSKLLSLDPEG